MTFKFVSTAKVTINLGDYTKPLIVPRRHGKQRAYAMSMQLFAERTKVRIRFIGWSNEAASMTRAAQARYRTASTKARSDMHLAARLRRDLRRTAG